MRLVVNMLEEDRAVDTGNMHKNLVKIAREVLEISPWTERQTYSSHYFATAAAGEVIKIKFSLYGSGWWRWVLVSPDGVAPSRMVCVSASVNLPVHHKVRSSLLAPAHPGGPGGAVKWMWLFGSANRPISNCSAPVEF